MVYVAAVPRDEPVSGCGSGELAEIRWARLAEAQALMSDMALAVIQHLARMLGG